MPDDTFLQPGRALSAANDLDSAGTSFYSKWTQLSNRIISLNEPGKKFAEQYVDGDNVSMMTIDAGNSIAPVLRDLGSDVRKAVQGTTTTDDLIEKWFPEE
jgi:hypothetical protein